jgi:hypothetical protein
MICFNCFLRISIKIIRPKFNIIKTRGYSIVIKVIFVIANILIKNLIPFKKKYRRVSSSGAEKDFRNVGMKPNQSDILNDIIAIRGCWKYNHHIKPIAAHIKVI